MPFNRTIIAAGGTLAPLAVLAAVALSAGPAEPSGAQPAAVPTPEVRTEIVRRTIRVPARDSASTASTPAASDRAPAAASAAQPSGGGPSVPPISSSGDDSQRHDDDRHG